MASQVVGAKLCGNIVNDVNQVNNVNRVNNVNQVNNVNDVNAAARWRSPDLGCGLASNARRTRPARS